MTDMTVHSSDIDLTRVFNSPLGVVIPESARLRLARQILFYLFLLCIGVFIAYVLLPDSPAAAQIFELVKIGALTLVTLVVSFYFPNTTTKG